MQHSRKKIATLLFAFFIVISFSKPVLAVSDVCPGEPVTLYWTSADVAGVCVPYYSIPACTFSVAQNTTQSTVITTSNSCDVSLTCDDVVVNDSIIINPDQSRCCGNWDLSAQNFWNGTSCVSRPDLTAGVASPATAEPGISTTLSAVITNSGGVTTGTSFDYFFQVADQAGGAGTIIDLPSSTMGTLAVSASNTGSKSYTFPGGPGTYSVRICVDKSDRNDAGSVTESNEGNNCGSPWTTVTVACTGTDQWDTIGLTCTDPRVVNAEILDQHYPPGSIRLECNADTTTYSITRDTPPTTVVAAGTPYTGPVTLDTTPPHGNSYTMRCTHGSVTDTAPPVAYDPTMDPTTINFTTGITTVTDPPVETPIKWVVANPTNSCTLTARIVCANNACTAAQLAEQTALNTILTSSSTDANDPNTSRPMLTAIRTPAPGHKDSDVPVIIADYKGIGKKTITIKYTTDLTYSCNGVSETKRIRVTKGEEQ